MIGIELGGVDDVVAAEPVDGERVEAGVHAAHDRLRCQSVDDNRRAAATTLIESWAAVPLTVTSSASAVAAPRSGEVDGDLIDVGSWPIVDRDIVSAA